MQGILWQAQKKHRKLFRTQWNWVSIHCFSFLPIASLNSLRAFGRLAVSPPFEIRALRPCKWWNLSFDWINWWNLKVILNIELCWSLRFLNEATLSLTRVPVDCRGWRWSPATLWFRKYILEIWIGIVHGNMTFTHRALKPVWWPQVGQIYYSRLNFIMSGWILCFFFIIFDPKKLTKRKSLNYLCCLAIEINDSIDPLGHICGCRTLSESQNPQCDPAVN